ncbi:MAG TPA: hypothetical protein VH637_18315 [Streptosporangiaceae bacterium]
MFGTGPPRAIWVLIRAHRAAAVTELKRSKDAGYTTETVVVIALLVAMALAAIAIIAAKVLAKANGLNLG